MALPLQFSAAGFKLINTKPKADLSNVKHSLRRTPTRAAQNPREVFDESPTNEEIIGNPQQAEPHLFSFPHRPQRVAYQGVRGSYIHEAAINVFPFSSHVFSCVEMEDVFQALCNKSADRGLIVAENSLEGTNYASLDLLMRYTNVCIVGDVSLPVSHCLLGIPGTSITQVKRLVADPQVINQCNKNIQLLNMKIEKAANGPSGVEKYLSNYKIRYMGVIGSKIAAKEFGLEILQQNFQDPHPNFNRFLLLGLRPSIAMGKRLLSGEWKTTIAFTLDKGLSDMMRALLIFEDKNVTVIKVEHRPNRSNPITVEKSGHGGLYFNYIWFLDLKGNISDPRMKIALSQLEEISSFIHVLGSYISS